MFSYKKRSNNAFKFRAIKKFASINDNVYQYLHKNRKISIINIEKKHCSCSQMVDIGICYHLVRLFSFKQLPLPGMAGLNQFNQFKSLIHRKTQRQKESEEEFYEPIG